MTAAHGTDIGRFGNNAVIAHLTSRRSVSARSLAEPGPSTDEVEVILQAGLRVPDHGTLNPWRLHIVEGEAREHLGDALASVFRGQHPDASEAEVAKERLRATRSPLLIVVCTQLVGESRFPGTEQFVSSGAVCMNVLHAVHALGYGAQWVTGWPVYDPQVRAMFGVGSGDHIVGWIHVGTPTMVPTDRMRAAIADVVSWWQPGED